MRKRKSPLLLVLYFLFLVNHSQRFYDSSNGGPSFSFSFRVIDERRKETTLGESKKLKSLSVGFFVSSKKRVDKLRGQPFRLLFFWWSCLENYPKSGQQKKRRKRKKKKEPDNRVLLLSATVVWLVFTRKNRHLVRDVFFKKEKTR